MTEMIGHNGQLKSIVERVEKLNEDKQAISADISDVFKEAKGNGFDVKALRKVIALRKLSADDRAHQDAILETYLSAQVKLAGTSPATEFPLYGLSDQIKAGFSLNQGGVHCGDRLGSNRKSQAF